MSLVLGDTLFHERTADYPEGNSDNYYLPGSGDPLETGDPREMFGTRDPRGTWGHFKKGNGSTMGFSYQYKRDHNGQTVNSSYRRLAKLQGRITVSSNGDSSNRKYYELAAPLRQFFPGQLLGRAAQLFEIVQPRLKGSGNDLSCFLACVEFWLMGQGMAIRQAVIREISETLDVTVTRDSITKHRMAVKRACIELYGRKETYSRYHGRGPAIVLNRTGEILIALGINARTNSNIRSAVKSVINELVATRYVPKHYSSHAYALLKIACEELGLVDAGSWVDYLAVDREIKRSVYSIAYKLRKKLNGWSFDITALDTVVEPVTEVMTASEVATINAVESTAEVVTEGEALLNITDPCAVVAAGSNHYRPINSTRDRRLALLALAIAVKQLLHATDTEIARTDNTAKSLQLQMLIDDMDSSEQAKNIKKRQLVVSKQTSTAGKIAGQTALTTDEAVVSTRGKLLMLSTLNARLAAS